MTQIPRRLVHSSSPPRTDIDSDVDLHYLFMDYAEMSPLEQERVKNLVERVSVELALPSAKERLAWNAEDPLASVHYYMVNMRVLIPLVFGIRMLPLPSLQHRFVRWRCSSSHHLELRY